MLIPVLPTRLAGIINFSGNFSRKGLNSLVGKAHGSVIPLPLFLSGD